ncbi:MAG: ABC transporter permease [Saprospiraceae bacterium]
MLTNHLKIAFRNLWNNRFFTLLNLSGLAIGLAVSLALMLFVRHEAGFDAYHTNASNIYRVNLSISYEDRHEKLANAPNVAGPAFKDGIEDVKEYTRFLRHNFGRTAFIAAGEKNFAETNFYWADNGLFRMFDVPLLAGDSATALEGPNKVVLSNSTARKMFGNESPIGKTLKVDNVQSLEITGVYEDFPANSSLDADLIGSFMTNAWASKELYWSNCSFETFLLLDKNADLANVQRQMDAIEDKAVPKEEQWFTTFLQPFEDIHLHSAGIAQGYSANIGDIRQVRMLSALALAVLLLACFNYINMTTARSQQRFREVGINKTLGASTAQMVQRFYVETGLLVAVALAIGVLLVEISLPLFESLSGKELSVSTLLNSRWVLALPAIWLAVTLAAGLYPALFLSNFSPKKLLAPKAVTASGKSYFRHTLVVGQFAVCVALIVGAIVFNRQLNFISQKKLGFEPEQVVAVTTAAAENGDQVDALMNAYRNEAAVKSVCRSMNFPGIQPAGYGMSQPGHKERHTSVGVNRVTAGFEEVLGLNFLAGHSLQEKMKDDTTSEVVLNETAVKFLGWTPEEAIGKSPTDLFQWPTTIVGVVEDFHFESMHQPIQAFAFSNANQLGWRPYVLVKMNTADVRGTMALLEADFKKYIPNSAFEYTFLDDHLAKMYSTEQRLSKVVLVFTLLTIFISCLGLFGLAAFTAERRTKEIGVRKVLGATVAGLVGLLAKDFLKPVLLAIVLAAPLAWWAMDKWLQDFAYRVELNGWYFVLAGFLAITVAFLTVGFQSLKAAVANPIESLRNE